MKEIALVSALAVATLFIATSLFILYNYTLARRSGGNKKEGSDGALAYF